MAPVLSWSTVEKIKFCWEQRLPKRSAARICKCDRKTVDRAYRRLDEGLPLRAAELLGLPERVTTDARRRLSKEAVQREMTVGALCVAILQIYAKENLFEWILNR